MNLLLFWCVWFSAVELADEPAWESNDSDYSTGGILADIDGDGDLDLVTGNGNDMARNTNKVYYNLENMLEETASWVSNDWACNGHISLGDMDGDGDLDLAAAGFALYSGTWDSDQSVIYENVEGTFTTGPVWQGADDLHAFSCDWGDADGDGDLDLALAAGNDYINLKQNVVIYENQAGELSAEPMWISDDTDYNMDVCWVDVDGDGDLDLAVGGYATNRIYFRDEGTLSTAAGWVSADSHHTVQVAFADFDADGDLDMATGDNNQIGDDESRVRVYLNDDGTLEPLPFWESKLWNYQSCVAWADVDADGDLDLAAGGWWEPASVYENVNNQFDTVPAWSWITSNANDLVCEQMVWGEVDNDNWLDNTESFGSISIGGVVYPSRFPILDIEEVTIGGSPALPGDYLWNPTDGWVQINQTGDVEITYRYSRYPDLAVTNWNRATGNYLLLNQADDTTLVAEKPAPPCGLEVRTEKSLLNRGETIRFTVSGSQSIDRVTVFDVSGRNLEQYKELGNCRTIDLPLNTTNLSPGVYFIRIESDQLGKTLKIQII